MSARVLVTGAASGLGAALVRRFVARGDRVLVTDLPRALEGLDHPAEGLEHPVTGGRVETLPLDVTSDEDWAAARDHVLERWGGLDLLVNNAGVAGGGRIDVLDLDHWHWITEINLFGVVRGCRTFTPVLKEQGSGHLVNIASAAGLVHPPGMSSYNAAKAGVVALSETLQFELAPYGITTSVVCPTFFRTNLADSLPGADPVVEQIATRLIDRSESDAEDIAAAVVAGIEAGTAVILPDAAARLAVEGKHGARELYDAEQLSFAEKIKAAEEHA